MYCSPARLFPLASAVLLALGLSLPASAQACRLPSPAATSGPSAAATPAAEASVLTSLSLAELTDALTAQGVTELRRLGCGESRVLVFEEGGVRVLALLKSDGLIVQLRAAWGDTGVDMDAINAWNSRNAFSRVYLDDEGDPVLVTEIDITGGITRARLADALRTYLKLSLPSFESVVIEAVAARMAAEKGEAATGDAGQAQPAPEAPRGV